jgi:hypothetical protein
MNAQRTKEIFLGVLDEIARYDVFNRPALASLGIDAIQQLESELAKANTLISEIKKHQTAVNALQFAIKENEQLKAQLPKFKLGEIVYADFLNGRLKGRVIEITKGDSWTRYLLSTTDLVLDESELLSEREAEASLNQKEG